MSYIVDRHLLPVSKYTRAIIEHYYKGKVLYSAEFDAKSEMSQGNINMAYTDGRGMYDNINMGFVRSNQPRMMRPVRNNMGRGLMRGAGTLRITPSQAKQKTSR